MAGTNIVVENDFKQAIIKAISKAQPQPTHTIDEDELADKYANMNCDENPFNGKRDEPDFNRIKRIIKEAIIGYKAANSKGCFSEADVLEIIRFAIYGGTPEFYEQGGVNGVINFPKGETYAKAKRIYEQYLKQLSQ